MKTDLETIDWLEDIARQDFDLDGYAGLARQDIHLRDQLVEQMCHHPHIMVYYHCFYVLEKASQTDPALFYEYRRTLADLLDHPNSYHRDFGLTLLANLAAIDKQNFLDEVLPAYLEHLNDPKFMTANCCLQNLGEIVKYKPRLVNQIIRTVLSIEQICTYPEKQKALLKYNVLELLENILDHLDYQHEIEAFIRQAVTCASPKTRSKAKHMLRSIKQLPPPAD